MFFQDVDTLVRTVIIGVLGYAALVVLLRVSGKRTLSKWNAFDLIVTIALGSTFATLLLSKQTTYAQGVLALALLILLQAAIARLALSWKLAQRVLKSQPRLLYSESRFVDAALTDERVSEAEVRAAVRGAGFGSLSDVHAVVLESDGSVSVIGKTRAGDGSALEDVKR